jgi:cyanophycinase-like exopeptidase
MTALPRVLAVMGSGETTPTMVTTHRRLLERLGAGAVPVLLDTPYGFQENADDLTERARQYFKASVGTDVEVASFRSAEEAGSLGHEQALARLRDARYVFSGPGSPTYALSQWQGSQVPDVLVSKLRTGGVVVFASAAAVTLGCVAIPVYEIYKVGEAPAWRAGLDLLAETGLRAAVIPHYDNAEGGTHDTRFCYLGERRLSTLEQQLPDDAFVLGVDEHTVLLLDIDAGTAAVHGRGGVTVRRRGRSRRFEADAEVAIDDLRAAAEHGGEPAPADRPPAFVPAAEGDATDAGTPLLGDLDRLEQTFRTALASGDGEGAVAAMLDLDETIVAWSRDSLQSDHLDRARSVLRSMMVRLGGAAGEGLRDPATVVGPFVDAVLAARAALRGRGDYEGADRLRDLLVAQGVEIRDAPGGTEWELR